MKEKKVEDAEVAKDGRIYEIGYLLVPTIGEDEVPALYGNIKELISALGGSIIMDEMPKMTQLHYVMTKIAGGARNKYDNAYFGWVKFEINPEELVAIKKKLDEDQNIIRYLMIKTVRENTIASKRLASRDGARRKKETKEGEPTEINKEEIDKEIEAMVAE